MCNLSLFKKYYANFDQIYLQQYMYEQGTSDKILTTGDVICKKCHSILYRYTGQQQHDKKVECVSPREYVSLILKQAVSGTLDIDINTDINKLALTELIKFVCTELMQNKALLLSEMVYKFQEFGGCFSSNLRQNQTRFILGKLQFIFSSNIDTDKIDKIGTIVKLHGVEDRRCLVLALQGHKKRSYLIQSQKLSIVSLNTEIIILLKKPV
ncbi:unnamed protein product [Mytilus coruscus]|uniref:Uncharacterized protein n=1 Tax=Mytilus coruscus TaxID=42192 RepID=A0A6J8A0N9_MYTCO|nr:unnamed protein product [Mytilus coruscus]